MWQFYFGIFPKSFLDHFFSAKWQIFATKEIAGQCS
jgi:hypothetical protein